MILSDLQPRLRARPVPVLAVAAVSGLGSFVLFAAVDAARLFYYGARGLVPLNE